MMFLKTYHVEQTTKGIIHFAKSNVNLIRKLFGNKNVFEYSLKEYKKRMKFGYVNPIKEIEKFYMNRFLLSEHLVNELQEIVCYSTPDNWNIFNGTRVGEFVVDCIIHLFLQTQNFEDKN
jgi:hypothetical protein